MESEHSHDDLMKEVSDHLKDMFDKSQQSMYLYLDDSHKICNKKFASLLGYKSSEEWAGVNKPFTETFVDSASQETLVTTYQKSMEKLVGSSIDVIWKKKNGEKIKTKVILVPFLFNGHLFALHFIS